MTLPHGTYRDAVEADLCPVIVGGFHCTLPANHAPLECAHISSSGTRLLGVVPMPGSIAMHDPVTNHRLPASGKVDLRGPEEHEDGSEWFRAELAKVGPCVCPPDQDDEDPPCEQRFSCPLCAALPGFWPCPSDGGYGHDAWVGPRPPRPVTQGSPLAGLTFVDSPGSTAT